MWRVFVACYFLLLSLPSAQAGAPLVPDRNDDAAVAAATHDLCSRKVALLGEAAGHGDGHTEDFKVRLVQALVTRCGYNAVFFEASHYEFIDLQRRLDRGEQVSPQQVGQAVGGVWKFDREVQPLLTFLAEAANEGRVRLGGLDGQLGGLEQPYANDVMPERLTRLLTEPSRSRCGTALHRRIYGTDTSSLPYSASNKQFLINCVSDMVRANADGDPIAQQELANLDRFLRLDLTDTPTLIAGRDRAMAENFRWLSERLGTHAKIIVWTATAHAARDSSAYPPFATVKPLGAFIHDTYGDDAFALGFSARSGAYRWDRKDNRPVAPPEAGSLELIAGLGGETAYLNHVSLQTLGVVPGGVFDHVARAAAWGRVVDGVVVFEKEYPPHSTRPGFE